MESNEETVTAMVALLLVKRNKEKKIRVGKTLAGEERYSRLV